MQRAPLLRLLWNKVAAGRLGREARRKLRAQSYSQNQLRKPSRHLSYNRTSSGEACGDWQPVIAAGAVQQAVQVYNQKGYANMADFGQLVRASG